MRPMLARLTGLAFGMALFAAPASAQIVHSLQLGAGVFVPRGYPTRDSQDVLSKDLDELDFPRCNAAQLQSCIRKEFTGGQLFGEWLMDVGHHVEFGLGAGFYSRTRPTVYAAYTHPAELGFSEIEQELHLRIAPVTAMVRFLAGRPGDFQPYVGVGVSALNYRYTEAGEFIDFDTLLRFNTFDTFHDRYSASGTAVGPVYVAGLRVPIGGDIWGFTTEWRYQGGVGKTGGLAKGFLDEKIDLSGVNVNFAVLVRY
jgi:hypothetical protein